MRCVLAKLFDFSQIKLPCFDCQWTVKSVNAPFLKIQTVSVLFHYILHAVRFPQNWLKYFFPHKSVYFHSSFHSSLSIIFINYTSF